MEERLLEYEERKRLKHIQAVQKRNREAREMANGTSSSNKGNASAAYKRLYDQAQKKKTEYEAQLERQAMSYDRDVSFQPKINKTSKKLAQKARPQHVSVEDSLVYRGQLTNYKHQMRQQRNDIQAKIRASEPKINPTSERILREKSANVTQEAAARLTKPIGTIKQRTKEGIEEPTFQPQINYKTPITWETPSNEYDGDVYNRSQKWLQEKQNRLERERKARERDELKQCSFKPNVVRKNPDSHDMDNSFSEFHENENLPIAERHAAWASKRFVIVIIYSYLLFNLFLTFFIVFDFKGT